MVRPGLWAHSSYVLSPKTKYAQLNASIDRYHVLPKNTYNLDEKGMMIGKIKQHHRIFSYKSMVKGRVLGVNEDGNREWITLLATICADGTWGRLLLIYPSLAGAL